MSVWRIVCPGPSLNWDSLMWADWSEEDYIMCVNKGINGAHWCDYWCCIDKPNEVHRTCLEDFKRLRPTLLTKRKRFPKWQATLGPDAILENMYGHPRYKDNWVVACSTGTTWSIMSGTAYAVACGAKDIHFYGVDLAGTTYNDGTDPKMEKRDISKKDRKMSWAKRHKSEVKALKRLWEASLKTDVVLHGLPVVVTGASKAAQER